MAESLAARGNRIVIRHRMSDVVCIVEFVSPGNKHSPAPIEASKCFHAVQGFLVPEFLVDERRVAKVVQVRLRMSFPRRRVFDRLVTKRHCGIGRINRLELFEVQSCRKNGFRHDLRSTKCVGVGEEIGLGHWAEQVKGTVLSDNLVYGSGIAWRRPRCAKQSLWPESNRDRIPIVGTEIADRYRIVSCLEINVSDQVGKGGLQPGHQRYSRRRVQRRSEWPRQRNSETEVWCSCPSHWDQQARRRPTAPSESGEDHEDSELQKPSASRPPYVKTSRTTLP